MSGLYTSLGQGPRATSFVKGAYRSLSFMPSEEIEGEEEWLRRRVVRLRTIMRFALDARVKTILKEFITEAEERLDKLGQMRE